MEISFIWLMASDQFVFKCTCRMSAVSQLGDTGDQLRQSEGTIILHISFAVKHDPELGKEFVKYLKVMNTS